MQVHELSGYALQLHNARKARLARFASRAIKPPKIVPVIEPEPEPEPEPDPVPIQVTTVVPIQVTTVEIVPKVIPELARPTLHQLIAETAAKYGVTSDDLKCQGRQFILAAARQEYCYRAMTETLCSMPMIGRALGGRDHTTVLSAARRYCDIRGLAYPRGAQWGARRLPKQNYWTEEKYRTFRTLVLAGFSAAAISERMQISTPTINRTRRSLGLPKFGRNR